MPKMKTHKGTAKRMKVTGGGKIRRHRSNARHLLSHKNAKRRRRLRGTALVTGVRARKIRNAIS